MPTSPFHNLSAELRGRAAKVKLAVFDVDGVLTDGKLVYSDHGRQLKAFHVHDGFGLKRLRANGIEVAIITARHSPMVAERCAELDIVHVYQGQTDKLACLKQLLHALNLTLMDCAYTGDDLPDLCVMRQVHLAVAVVNAHPWIREHAHWQTSVAGGNGAAREVCDLILHVQGRDASELAHFRGSL